MKIHCSFLSIVTLLLVSIQAIAAEHRVEVNNTGPPADKMSKEIAAQLSSSGFKVIRGESRTICEVWLCKEWVVDAKFKPTAEVLYPFTPGQFIGVVNYPRKGGDFRDQDIGSGVYTLRYAQQPVDGNHVGTSPTRDFFLLLNAEKDQKAGTLGKDALIRNSAEAAGSTHPAMLCLQRAKAEAKDKPTIRHNEEHDWWIVTFQGNAKAGKVTKKLAIELVVVGVAAE